jgi:lysophospholipase L1-like esterase
VGWLRTRTWPAATIGAIVLAISPAAARAESTPLVSLGDSYSSGEGAGPFDPGTDSLLDRCHRSANAWPRLLGVPRADHLACSGATTAHFFRGKTIGRPDNVGQLARLRAIAAQGPIDRVVVTIGGNDLGFKSIVRTCFLGSCLQHIDDVELPLLRDAVRPAVTKALRATRTASGGADVVLVGYPDVVAPVARESRHCGWLSDPENLRLRRLQRELDSEQRAAAADAGVSYISVRRALRGHELCTTESWVRPIGGVGTPIQQRGHPNPDGQRAIASLVGARLGLSRAITGGASARLAQAPARAQYTPPNWRRSSPQVCAQQCA